MMKIPNYFIIGAPKCGTTALSEYLKEHPNVFLSTPKEPHYFATDMTGHRSIETYTDYISIFSEVQETHHAVGEASVWYLYSSNAIKNIRLFNPAAKIIVMLRKPVDMVYSMHSQAVFSLGEDVRSFERAWDLEFERKLGKFIPKQSTHTPILYYSEIAKYHSQLQRLYQYFPANQVKVILFEDFVNDTQTVFSDTVDFLKLPHFRKSSFEKINENSTAEFSYLRKMLKKESRLARAIRIKIKESLGIKNIGLRSALDKKVSRKSKRSELPDYLKEKVIENYRAEVNELSKILDKDLSEWNKM